MLFKASVRPATAGRKELARDNPLGFFPDAKDLEFDAPIRIAEVACGAVPQRVGQTLQDSVASGLRPRVSFVSIGDEHAVIEDTFGIGGQAAWSVANAASVPWPIFAGSSRSAPIRLS